MNNAVSINLDGYALNSPEKNSEAMDCFTKALDIQSSKSGKAESCLYIVN